MSENHEEITAPLEAPTQNEPEKTAQEQLNEQKEHYLRIIADYENRMKRTTQDSINAISSTIERLLSDIIPLIKDINQAAATTEGTAKTGLEMIEKNMKTILGKYGIKEISAEIGQTFDPHTHQALGTIQKDGVEEGKIVEIIQTGYSFNKKTILPAMVIVSE